jgi:hypothetical protein
MQKTLRIIAGVMLPLGTLISASFLIDVSGHHEPASQGRIEPASQIA